MTFIKLHVLFRFLMAKWPASLHTHRGRHTSRRQQALRELVHTCRSGTAFPEIIEQKNVKWDPEMQVTMGKHLEFQKPSGSENWGVKTEGITGQSSAEAALHITTSLNTRNSTEQDPAALRLYNTPWKPSKSSAQSGGSCKLFKDWKLEEKSSTVQNASSNRDRREPALPRTLTRGTRLNNLSSFCQQQSEPFTVHLLGGKIFLQTLSTLS